MSYNKIELRSFALSTGWGPDTSTHELGVQTNLQRPASGSETGPAYRLQKIDQFMDASFNPVHAVANELHALYIWVNGVIQLTEGNELTVNIVRWHAASRGASHGSYTGWDVIDYNEWRPPIKGYDCVFDRFEVGMQQTPFNFGVDGGIASAHVNIYLERVEIPYMDWLNFRRTGQ